MQLTIDIGNEVRSQNAQLESMVRVRWRGCIGRARGTTKAGGTLCLPSTRGTRKPT